MAMTDMSGDACMTTFKETDSFAAYSLPGSGDFHLCFQEDFSNTTAPPNIGSYFVIAPFRRDVEVSRYIRADRVITNQEFSLTVPKLGSGRSTDRSKYLSDVEHIINDIQNKSYQKLVYSRIITSERNGQGVYQMYKTLVDRYIDAFVFCYYTPEGGCWMGATPELLVEDADESFRSIALAGTQIDMGIPLDQVSWDNKEIVEHQYLKEYIEQCLYREKIVFTEGQTKTVKAGNVVHISTEFSIEKAQQITHMADLLHPGPAICGTPQKIAKQYITNYEDHDRADYCGYIGVVGIGDCNAIYINLRSMQIFKSQLQLYVGGGITIDSIPEAEWEETQNKSLTLLNVIQNGYNH